jgi:YVTN family beta-propeller protein
MTRTHLHLFRPFVLALAAAIPLPAAEPPWLSPETLAAAADGTVWVTMADAPRLLRVDTSKGEVAATLALPDPATGIAVAANGRHLLATTGVAFGKLLLLDPADGRIEAAVEVGHSPLSPLPAPDGRRVFVLNRFLDSLAVVDLAEQKVVKRIAVAREPVAAVMAPDGKRLFVANHLPAGAADAERVAAVVSLVDPEAGTVETISLPNGSTALRGITLSPDGRHVYVTHTLSRFTLPTTQLDRGWMNTSALTIIDAVAGKAINTVLLDDVDLGAANPWGLACSPDGATLAVAHSGTHEVSLIDRTALHERLDRAARGERVTEVTSAAASVPNDLSFLYGARRRILLDGEGPRALAAAGGRFVAATYFSDRLHLLEAGTQAAHEVRVVALGPPPRPDTPRLGEMVFHDARACFQHWQSCATCHPDGRADALNWDLLNDGIGNPKQTKNMLLSMDTPPSMMSGVRESPELAIRSGFRFIQFAVRPESDAHAVEEYVRQMRPVPSPRLVGGQLSESARRGEVVFREAGCAHCHPGPHYTNLKAYNVGTGTGREADKEWDTPSLVEIWRTAPYLYDGRAATMHEALTKFNHEDRHGRTSQLSQQQLDDLVEFVLSL